MHTLLKILPLHTQIIISISIIILSGFLMSRVTKYFKLPTVTGYIVAGIIIGPDILHLIPRELVKNFSFISDVALSFIAFDVGRFLKREVIESSGIRIILLTIAEALAAGILVFLSSKFLFHLDFNFALLLGAIATATAPASTMMTIKEFRAKGDFINTLLQVVAFDDVVCLLVFSASIAWVQNTGSAIGFLKPILFNLLAMGIGLFIGLILHYLMTPSRSQDNRLLIAVALILLLTGFCQILGVSSLLSCMICGATYRNNRNSGNLFRQLNNFTPPIMTLFFIVSGMNLSLGTVFSLKVIGIGYVLIRILGKYLGSYFAGKALAFDLKTYKYLGLALVPQAGVALGLGFMGQRLLGGEIGNLFLNIILASSVLYELIGPALAKYAILNGADSIEE
ncbi:MAG: cation:proton antiporter [Tissierellia bacterium]|nr:cation:proton antiporter [Tissierellia bacterium]